MNKIALRAALSAATLFALSAPVFAHATLVIKEAEVGGRYKGTLTVPHGCGDEATHTVKISIPEGFHSVKPMPHAGWELETVHGDYENVYDNHGRDVTSGVKEIIWSGGDLPNEWFDEFSFRGSFGKSVEPGVFYFPATQVCATAELNWVGEVGDEDAKPAPKLTLSAPAAEATGHVMAAAAPAMVDGVLSVGDLELSAAFTRAMPPAAAAGGGFVTIANNGGMDDRLLSVEANVGGAVEIHEMKIVDDVMKMSSLPDGLVIPAGETVSLAPGGYHIMFIGVDAPFVEGEEVAVTLNFEHAGSVELALPVAPIGSTAAPMAGMSH